MTKWEKDIEDDLTWRLEEMKILRIRLPDKISEPVAHRALLRANWAMLYAHYEGFCFNALNVFLRYLIENGIAPQDCRRPLLELALEKPIRRIRSATTGQMYDFFLNEFQNVLQSTVDFDEDFKHGGFELKGRSNLYPDLLASTCDSVCLPHSELDEHQARLKVLVLRRNGIAHGKDIAPLNVEQLERFEEAAIAVMYDLAYSVIEAMATKSYLAATPISARAKFHLP